jgi:hypothetical protein
VRLTTSLLVGAKYFGCVVCRFHVAAGAELRPDRRHKQIVWSVAKLASINLRKWFLSPTSLIKPWFHTEGNLSMCSSYLPLGVPNWVAKHRQSMRQVKYYGKNAVMRHTPVEFDTANPIEERQNGKTKKTIRETSTQHSCQSMKSEMSYQKRLKQP